MKHTHIVGIDPGIVHTGVVGLEFLPAHRELRVYGEVVLGTDASRVGRLCKQIAANTVFIEGYRQRGAGSRHDREMLLAVREMQQATGGKVLDNMGVKTVITTDIMKALGCWTFSTPTHHQDLRSAARIALLGFIKTDDGNRLIADIIRDHLDGSPWTIH